MTSICLSIYGRVVLLAMSLSPTKHKVPYGLYLGKCILNDILKKNLKIVFVGSAASDISASQGYYYANPRNSFWKLLYEAGLTDRQLLPKEDSLVLNYDCGLTDVVKSEHGTDIRLRKESLAEDRSNLEAKIKEFHPLVVCFTSKNAYRLFFGHSARSFGLQKPEGELPSEVFIVPSPSPQVMPDKRFNGKSRLEWYKELSEFAKKKKDVRNKK